MGATFLWVMTSESSAFYPTYGVSRALVARGHRVKYLVFPDYADEVAAQGLEVCTSYFDDICPRGSLRRAWPPVETRTVEMERALEAAATERRWRMVRERFRAPESDGLLRDLGADVALVDSLFWPMLLVARRAGLRAVSVATYFAARLDGSAPHAGWYLPGRGSRARLRLDWELRRAQWYVENMREAMRFHTPFLPRELRGLVRDAGLPVTFREYGPEPIAPEIVLGPRELDFEGVDARPERVYMGHGVDEQRAEAPLELGDDEGQHLVYFSLGTHSDEFAHGKRAIDAVLELARRRPDTRFVVAIGRGREPAQFADAPANATLCKVAPQLRVLRRASVMITCGGLGTLKECALFGVPTIVYYRVGDQPGNAARVVRHGLGVAAHADHLTVEHLAASVDHVLADPMLRARVAALGARLRAGDEAERGLAFLEQEAALCEVRPANSV